MSIFSTNKMTICNATAAYTGKTITGDGTRITIPLGTGHGQVAGNIIHVTGSAVAGYNAIWEIESVTATEVKALSSVTGSGTGSSIRLGYMFKVSQINFDMVQPDILEFRSVITGKKTHTYLGDYGMFEVTDFLFQGTSLLTAKQKFQRLYSLYHQDLWLFPHSNKAVQDSGGKVIACYFKEFKPGYYQNLVSFDIVRCVFETNEYHTVTGLLA